MVFWLWMLVAACGLGEERALVEASPAEAAPAGAPATAVAGSTPTEAPAALEPVAPKLPPDLVAAAQRALREASEGPSTVVLLDPTALEAGYASPELRWVAEDLTLAKAGVEALRSASDHGYKPAVYHADAVAERLEPPWDAQRLAEADRLLTDGYTALAAHLWAGRIHPVDVDASWHALREGFDVAGTLDAARTDPMAALLGVSPKAPAYHRLVAHLQVLRSVAEAGGWPLVSGSERIDETSPVERVRALVARLHATGDLASDLSPDAYDEAVTAGVDRFQRRHGLEPTGKVGKRTLAALNVPVADRIATVRVNLERWRWLPDVLGERHVRVNIAGFALEAREAGEQVMTMGIVVGRSQRQTPVFSSTINRVVYNPSWTVPSGIAAKDVLPAVRKDPAYLNRKGIQVVQGRGDDARVVDASTIDWNSPGARNVTFRQPPGASNALGRVKLLFPNSFQVYLHDTPSKDLFGETRRDFSSGCVRLSRPLELAAWVLEGQPQGTPEAVEKVLASGRETSVKVERPVQVHMQYATAWVDEDGTVQWREDIYARDGNLLAALAKLPDEWSE